MKKILITIDWFLPGYKAGGPVSSIPILVAHLKNDFEFYIITRDTDYLESLPYSTIKSNQWNDFDVNTKVFYISNENINKKFITNLIKNTKFDIAYINGIYSYFFSILPLQISKKIKPNKTIVCARGMLSEQAFSRKSLKKNIFIITTKLNGLFKNIIFHATNENEKNDIQKKLGSKNEIFVVPNLTRKIENIIEKQIIKNENELNIVSIARISHEKNTKFALEWLKNISEGKINFDIYGSIYDSDYWNECLEIIKYLPKNIKVEYKNTIDTSKVVETFSNYHVSLMPSVGENFGHSILESFIAGTPVITSKNTPWKYLENKHIGWDLDLNNISGFETAIKNCLKMPQEKYNELSKNCFISAKTIFENSENKNLYKKLFE